MKYILKGLTLSVGLVALLSSCSSDWLNVSPSDGVTKIPENYNEAKIFLNGVYDALQGGSNRSSYYAARMIYYGDVKADDMQPTQASSRSGASYLMDYDVNSHLQIWQIPYTVINRANTLLKSIDSGSVIYDPDDNAIMAKVKDIKGQALAARAIAHFDLLRVYSRFYTDSPDSELGIPIVLKSEEDFKFTPSRNKVGEVYDQIIKDLKEAIELMRARGYNDVKDPNDDFNSSAYFNKWSAKALLARVYLYKGDDESAYKTATDIIESKKYTLWSNQEYVNMWSKQGTSEHLFEIVNYNTADWADRESIGYLYSEDGYEDAIMTKAYIDFVKTKYDGDVRSELMKRSKLPDEEAKRKEWGTEKVYITKYPGREGTNDPRINNIPILRLSEVYLIAAESAYKLGDLANAVKYLNVIVLRGNPSATPVTASTISLKRILEENRIEFIGEGHRYFDLIRNLDKLASEPGSTPNDGKIVRYTSELDRGWHLPLKRESMSFDRSYFRNLLPIPHKEIESNKSLAKEQNPGY